MGEKIMNKADWENWITLVLGIWLFFVPWTIPTEALAASVVSLASWNFWIVGAVIAVSAGMALDELKPWEEWVNLALGLWLVICPWVIGFTPAKGLMLNALIVGAGVMVFSGIALPVAQRNVQQKQGG
jgi:hypothetical protein